MSIASKHFYRFTYLHSEEWKGVRALTLARDEAKCSICGKVDWSNDVHHVRYPRNIWKTTPIHLVTLCRRCHDKIHGYLQGRGKLKNWDKIKAGFIYGKIKPRCFICKSKTNLTVFHKGKYRTNHICDSCNQEIQAKTFSSHREKWNFVSSLCALHRSSHLTEKAM